MRLRSLPFWILFVIFAALGMAQVTPLAITTTALPAATVGVPYNQMPGEPPGATLVATGGTPPYVWGITSGTLPTGLSLNSATGMISGTPAATAVSATIVFEVTDSALPKANTATRSLTLTVIVPLTITTTTLPSDVNGVAYPSTTLAAAGGTPPYTWALANPSGTLPAGTTAGLPPGLSLSASGAIAGTPTAMGSFEFSAQVKDSAATPATATGTFTITITSANPPPALTITAVGSTGPNQQPGVTIASASAAKLALTGTLTLTFAALASTGVTDDPNIQFLQSAPSTGSRQITFTIPAGQTQATFTNGTTKVATGTVAGTITLTVTSLTDSTGAIVPPPTPLTISIPASAPVITNVTINSGVLQFSINVTGFSPTRDATSITFQFVPTTGTNLAQSLVTVNVSAPFAAYYATASSKTFGSEFVATVPFTFNVSGFPFAAVSVSMTNSAGASLPAGPYNP